MLPFVTKYYHVADNCPSVCLCVCVSICLSIRLSLFFHQHDERPGADEYVGGGRVGGGGEESDVVMLVQKRPKTDAQDDAAGNLDKEVESSIVQTQLICKQLICKPN